MDTDKRVVPPIPFVYSLGFQNFRCLMCRRATKTKLIGEAAIAVVLNKILFISQLNFISLAENESKARVKFNLLEKMIQPCGPPTEKKQED